jgi:hypothetical protein
VKLRKSVITGLSAGSLALFGLGCEVEEDPGEELIPDNDVEENGDG